MKFTLSKKDFELILQVMEALPDGLNYIDNNDLQITLEADKETLDSLLDELSNILAEKGFDEDENVNPTGLRIERIIDSVSKEFYN
ncbi:hypothetical protein [Robiginitalea sediminis]|uniref:hypothetical protein n=1 Tax=Robiginitalea sediminis TaxID=1982593 RepID=UPI000B4BB51F|nr:hypothetical protein [Robiginitalea sediminis]